MRASLLLVPAIALLAGGARAQTSAPPPGAPATPGEGTGPPDQTILFVGNSFLHGRFLPVRHYNAAAITDENFSLPTTDRRSDNRPGGENGPFGGIPGIFKQLTDEAGQHYEVHIEAVSATPLEFHAKFALETLAQPRWNAVVLQEYSTYPLPSERGGKRDKFVASTGLLEKAIHAANPTARVYLYETPPRADLTFPEKAPYHAAPRFAMGTDLHEGYQRAFTEDGHFEAVVPVGDAWLSAMRTGVATENPYASGKTGQVDLWGSDHYHPGIHGAYLAALVLFQQFTGRGARTLGAEEKAAHDLGISPPDAVRLQTVAETVRAPAASPARPGSSG